MLLRDGSPSPTDCLRTHPVGDPTTASTCKGSDLGRTAQGIDDRFRWFLMCLFHACSCIDFRNEMQAPSVSILETDLRRPIIYHFDMRDWVVKAVEDSRLSQADIVRRLHSQCGWSDNKTIFNKIYTGKRELGAQEMFDISQVTGVPIPALGAKRDWRTEVKDGLQSALDAGADQHEIVTFVVDETIRLLAELAHSQGADVRQIVEEATKAARTDIVPQRQQGRS